MEQLKFCVALSYLVMPAWFKSRIVEKFNFDFKELWKNIDRSSGHLEYVERIKKFNEWQKIDKIIEQAIKSDVKIITVADNEYPVNLKNIHDFPVLLFTKGNTNLLNSLSIALVGSRQMTMYGKSLVSMFVPDLVKAGFCTVSGMAKGIDAEVHKVTINNKGNTVAVLGAGIDVIYPAQNKLIYESILNNNGLILSEFVFGTAPLKPNFPQRNRIIAGLSKGVLVIEAGEKSGSLITAYLAETYSRDVFSVPGPVNCPYYIGNNNLIKKGAVPTLSVQDIFDHYELLFKKTKINKNNNLTEKSKNLLKLIDPKGIDLNELLVLSGLPLLDLYLTIEELEQNKRICRDEFGGFFLT